MTLIKTW